MAVLQRCAGYLLHVFIRCLDVGHHLMGVLPQLSQGVDVCSIHTAVVSSCSEAAGAVLELWHLPSLPLLFSLRMWSHSGTWM